MKFIERLDVRVRYWLIAYYIVVIIGLSSGLLSNFFNVEFGDTIFSIAVLAGMILGIVTIILANCKNTADQRLGSDLTKKQKNPGDYGRDDHLEPIHKPGRDGQ